MLSVVLCLFFSLIMFVYFFGFCFVVVSWFIISLVARGSDLNVISFSYRFNCLRATQPSLFLLLSQWVCLVGFVSFCLLGLKSAPTQMAQYACSKMSNFLFFLFYSIRFTKECYHLSISFIILSISVPVRLLPFWLQARSVKCLRNLDWFDLKL